MNNLVHLTIQGRVFIREALRQMLLVGAARLSAPCLYPGQFCRHLLCSLICPEAQGSSSAFHYHIRIQAAENACLVILGWVEIRNNHIIRINEMHIASWANRTLAFLLARELKLVRAIDAEDMADILWLALRCG